MLFDVTLLSYTQCGLHKQFQRTEADTYANPSYLFRKLHGAKAPVRNVPNRYLAVNVPPISQSASVPRRLPW